MTTFLDEFSSLLTDIVSSPCEILISGDFNIQVDDTSAPYTSSFLSLLDSFGLTQHIDRPTHEGNHTLDLLISRQESRLISNFSIIDPILSDHFALVASLSVSVPKPTHQTTRTVRALKSINITQFRNDILQSDLYSAVPTSLSDYFQLFKSTLCSLLDKHAPMKTVSCSNKVRKPFITPDIIKAKRVRSRLERIYRRSKSSVDQQNFKAQSRCVAKMITEARRNYYKNLIDSSACKPKKLWSSLNAILHRSARSILPTASSSGSLATKFMKFFSDKITKLNANLVSTNISPHSNPTVPPPILSSFSPATQEEVRNVILSMSDSTCSLDFLPTKLLKSCLPALLTPITNLINLCIAESTVPSEFKHALITPLLKKDSLPKDDLSSYRPISNLNFLSKVLERIINNRLLTHLNSFPSLSPFQSAYRKFHSVETALLKIQNDLLLAIDKKKVSAVVLLDLSAAFDTVDHQILLTRMSSHFGIQGSAIEFLSSYLISRTQSVVIDSLTSTPTLSLSGVPQGSILGPLLFSLYTTPLATELLSSGLSFHMYADDTQLYISFSANNSAGALAHLTATLDTVHSWLSTNRLSLNPSKTEFLIVGSKQQRDKLNFSSFTFGGNTISYAPAVRNLGVMFDSNLSFDSQISNISRLSHY